MRRSHVASALGLGLALSCAHAAQAVVITFDSEAYSSTGEFTTVSTYTGTTTGATVHGQGGSPTWNDNATDPRFLVVANAGNGGDNNGLVSASTQLSATTTYTPSLAQLGVAAFSSNSKQAFSLDVKLISPGDLSGNTELYRLGIGAASASIYPAEIRIRANGALSVYMDNTSVFSTAANTLVAGGDYRTISGEFDYAAGTASIFLDGMQIGSTYDIGTYSSYGQFRLNVRSPSSTVGIALDNLSVSVVVPEPATATAMAGAAGILLGRPGRRRREQSQKA